MLFHADQIVALVRVDQLLVQGAFRRQFFREHHRLLEVHIIVGRTVDLLVVFFGYPGVLCCGKQISEKEEKI